MIGQPAGAASEKVLLCHGCDTRRGFCRFGLTQERMLSEDEAEFDVFCAADTEGGPGVAHGGWIASVLDETLGHLPKMQGFICVTAQLNVTYRRPVPIDRMLFVRALVHERAGARWRMSAELRLHRDGPVLASADCVYVMRDEGHFERHRQWLARMY